MSIEWNNQVKNFSVHRSLNQCVPCSWEEVYQSFKDRMYEEATLVAFHGKARLYEKEDSEEKCCHTTGFSEREFTYCPDCGTKL